VILVTPLCRDLCYLGGLVLELEGGNMKRFSFFLLAIIALGGAIAFVQPAAADETKAWGLEVGTWAW
jgi:hypothetical protein